MADRVQEREALFQLTGVGVAETDMATGRLVRANRTFCELVGYSEAELRKMTYLELTHPDDRVRDAACFSELRRGDLQSVASLTRVLHKDGEVVWLELHVTLVQEGNNIRNLTVANDMTERRRAEEALRELNETLEQRVAGRTEELHRAINEVVSDASWFSSKVMERLAAIRTGDAEATEYAELSKREREVLERMARGMGNDGIASELGIAKQTVRNYITTIYDKIGVHSRVEAVLWARERGIVGE